MRNKTGRRFGLWNRFVSIVFGILLLTGGITYVVILTAVNMDLFKHMEFNFAFSMSVAILLSLIIGSAITFLVGKQILTPLLKLNHASKEIAGGNFQIKLETATPIREIKEIYSNFNQMAAELASIELMRNDFIAQFSHEFKTPLTSIEGYAALLQDEALSIEDHRQYVQMILDSSAQLSNLSASILKLSKLENQDIITEKTRYRLDEQLRQALLYFEREWTEKNLELKLELPQTMFYQNPKLMMQIWLNLLSNAIKFTPPNGRIEVGLFKREKEISVSVKDSGIGMEKQVQRHIFDKFYQGDSSRSENGNGLGLAMVARIVKMGNGRIEVTSTPGKGSEFVVSFPVENAK